MPYILSLDQGTTSSRCVLVNEDGKIHRMAQKEFPQYFKESGWVEHDPKEIWSSQMAVISEVLSHGEIEEVQAIGITNQRETTIIWDRKTSQPVYNAIVWQDRRTTTYCEKLKKEGLEPLFKKKTGLLLDPYFSATKIRWILEHIQDGFERAKRGELAFGTVDSWLIWKLTGGQVHATDASNASRTLLYNLNTGTWDPELLEIFQIPKEMLPEIKDSSAYYGQTGSQVLPKSIPICGVAGDQQAALFGQNCVQKGMLKNTYGTGCFMLMNTGDTPVFSENNLLTTVAYQIDGKRTYALEGSVFIGGAVVKWLRDNLGLVKTSSEVDSLAASVKSTEGVYFVPAFTGLGAPYWDPYARGSIVGLSRGTTAAHIAKAALESIAYQVFDVADAMQKDAGIAITEMRVDGGASVSDPLLQFQADILGLKVIRPSVMELSVLGAAFLAGLCIGLWKETSSFWTEDKSYYPNMDHEEIRKRLGYWKKAIKITQSWEEP